MNVRRKNEEREKVVGGLFPRYWRSLWGSKPGRREKQ